MKQFLFLSLLLLISLMSSLTGFAAESQPHTTIPPISGYLEFFILVVLSVGGFVLSLLLYQRHHPLKQEDEQ